MTGINTALHVSVLQLYVASHNRTTDQRYIRLSRHRSLSESNPDFVNIAIFLKNRIQICNDKVIFKRIIFRICFISIRYIYVH